MCRQCGNVTLVPHDLVGVLGSIKLIQRVSILVCHSVRIQNTSVNFGSSVAIPEVVVPIRSMGNAWVTIKIFWGIVGGWERLICCCRRKDVIGIKV